MKLRQRIAERALLLAEASKRVERQYREEAKAQEGDLGWFAVGIWMVGLDKKQLPGIEEAVGISAGASRRGWWDAVPPRRECWFFAMAVEASSADRATLRCLDHLIDKFNAQGISSPAALRIEAEPTEGRP